MRFDRWKMKEPMVSADKVFTLEHILDVSTGIYRSIIFKVCNQEKKNQLLALCLIEYGKRPYAEISADLDARVLYRPPGWTDEHNSSHFTYWVVPA